MISTRLPNLINVFGYFRWEKPFKAETEYLFSQMVVNLSRLLSEDVSDRRIKRDSELHNSYEVLVVDYL